MKRKRDISVLYSLLLGTLLLLLGAIPAQAAFPGKNGRIAFIQDGEVFTINPDGSDIQQLTHIGPDSAASWAAWSADGRQIVFNESPPPDGKPEIWLMNADGTNQHLVFAETNYSENRPSFSPDGLKIVFGRCKLLVLDGDTCAIYTIGVNGVGLTRVTSFLLDTSQRSPMFSPNGTRIAFIRSNDTAAGFLGVTYLVNADGSNLHRITEPEPCFIRPDWSPDGTKLTAFTHFCDPQPEEIAVINSDGSGLQYLTHNGKDYFGGPHDRTPSFSPDGNFIVFERNAPDFSSSAIYVMKFDGSGEKLITAVHPSRRTTPHLSVPYATRSRLTKIEEGGSTPRWGVAPE